VQTLNFLPYRVDLTPFAGVLSNGQPHQVGLSVFGADNYFLAAGSLLLYLDHGAAHVTGAVTQNTVGAPHPTVQENLTTAADGSISGTVTTGAERRLTLAGYVNTSHGKVETTVRQSLSFSNDQKFVVSNTQYVQDIRQGTKVSSLTETKQGHAVSVAEKQLSYPLTLDISLAFNADGSSSQTTSSDQSFVSQEARIGTPGLPSLGFTSNQVKSADTLLFDASGALTGFQDRKSSQTYYSLSSSGCYSRTISSQDGLLTAVTDGQGCTLGHGGH
jgi:hypothetical protein